MHTPSISSVPVRVQRKSKPSNGHGLVLSALRGDSYSNGLKFLGDNRPFSSIAVIPMA